MLLHPIVVIGIVVFDPDRCVVDIDPRLPLKLGKTFSTYRHVGEYSRVLENQRVLIRRRSGAIEAGPVHTGFAMPAEAELGSNTVPL